MLKRLDVTEVLAGETRRRNTGRIVRTTLILAGSVAIVLLAGWGVWWWQSQGTPTYLTDTVVRSDLVVSLVATGTLQPDEKVAVSSLVTGTIASVDVDYNQTVVKGQPLAHLDPHDFDAAVTRATAMVDASSANRDAQRTAVSDAEGAYERAIHLPKDQVVSAKDVDLATNALERANANLDAAEAQLRASEQDLVAAQSDRAKATIVSPLDGVVLDVNAHVGQTVSAALLMTPLFTLAGDLRNLELDVDVDEADVSSIVVGDRVSFTVESATDHPIEGKVLQVRSSPTVNDGVTSYTAVVEVNDHSGLLKPGMTATAQIETDRAGAVVSVPNSALRFTPPKLAPAAPGVLRVFVVRLGRPQAIVVTTGITDGQRTEITGGNLMPGDIVLTGVKGY